MRIWGKGLSKWGVLLEDPTMCDDQASELEFDRDHTSELEYGWPLGFDDPDFKSWVKDGMGFHGCRGPLHKENTGCVVRMKEADGDTWRAVRRLCVWVSTEFLMPVA